MVTIGAGGTLQVEAGIVSLEFFRLIALFNFALGMFNLLPIPPLDGFHVASELFPGMKAIASSQAAMALLMILFITGAGGIFFTVAMTMTDFLIAL